MPPDRAPARTRKPGLVYVAAASAFAAAVALLSYIPAPGYFWEDDFVWAVHARGLQADLSSFFSTDPNFRPAFRLFALLCDTLSGGDPGLCCVFPAVLHALVCALFCWLLCLLLDDVPTGLAASVLFASTNSHSDAILWFSASAGPLAFFFFLPCLLCWISYRKGFSPALSYGLSLLFMAFAMLSKEEAAVFPFVLALTDIAVRPGKELPLKKRFAGYLPFFGLLAAYAAALVILLTRPGAGSALPGGNFSISPGHALSNLASASFFTLFPSESAPRPALMFAGLAVVFAVGLLAADRRRFLWAAAWTTLALSPMSLYAWDFYEIIQIAAIRRYLYVPSAGAAVILAAVSLAAIRKVARGRPDLVPLLNAVILVLFVSAAGLGVAGVRERAAKIWGPRFAASEAESFALTALHPEVETPAGFCLAGFSQREYFEKYFLEYLYAGEDVRAYSSTGTLYSEPGLKGRYVLSVRGGVMTDIPGGRARALYGETRPSRLARAGRY